MKPHAVLSLGLLLVLTPSLPLRDGERRNGGEAARIFTDPEHGSLVIELAPVDLPANTSHHDLAQPPVATLHVPQSGYVHGFRVDVVDSAGNPLPSRLLHHYNLIDPDHRELFLPISRRLLAAGTETGTVRLPRLLHLL